MYEILEALILSKSSKQPQLLLVVCSVYTFPSTDIYIYLNGLPWTQVAKDPLLSFMTVFNTSLYFCFYRKCNEGKSRRYIKTIEVREIVNSSNIIPEFMNRSTLPSLNLDMSLKQRGVSV